MTRIALLVASLALFTGCPDTTGGGYDGGADDGFGGGVEGPGGGVGGPGGETTGGDAGIDIDDERAGPDGCPTATLDSSTWSPIHASWNGGADPFFHLHSQESAFYFSVELYTEYGAGWTGDVGTFAPDCGANGICVYLASDDFGVFRATAGDVDVVTLSHSSGSIDRPAEVHFRDLTLVATEDGGGEGCLHVEEASLIAR